MFLRKILILLLFFFQKDFDIFFVLFFGIFSCVFDNRNLSFLKDDKGKIKREIEELFLKLIIMSMDDMDKQNEMKKIKPIKNTWYHWLIK